jgi:uncharacterized SAM-binding protein YcdF (DUF218 family)
MMHWFARALARPLERRDPFATADAIVILGSPLRSDGGLGPILEERVRAGVELWRRGAAPRIVMTGGRNPRARHDGTEADAMAAFARGLGVPADVLSVERESRYTMENALRTAPLLEGCRSVWVVTTPFHLRRAAMWFERLGFEVRGCHIDGSVQYQNPWRALRWVVKEYGALMRDLLTPR